MTMGLRVIIILLTWCIVNCVSILNNQGEQITINQLVGYNMYNNIMENLVGILHQNLDCYIFFVTHKLTQLT